MATGVSVFGSDLTAKQWSEATILLAEKYSNIQRFIGEGPNNIIERRTDLNKGKGQTIEFDLLKKATGDPIINEEELAGNEEKMEFVADTVKIAEMAFARKKYGKFEDIKSKKDLLSLMKQHLAIQIRETYDSYIIRLLCGDTTLDKGDGAWRGTAPTTYRKLYGGDWDGASTLDSGDDWLRVRDISRVKTYARVSCGISPIIVDGVETYVMILHPYQWEMIRAKDPDYKNAMLYAEERGKENPLFTGAIQGYWDGVAIFINDHIIQNSTYTDARRGLFLGAQAGMLAWGEGPYAGEQDYDYGRKKGISISMLWGFKKSVLGPDNFQNPSSYNQDYGVIAVDSYAVAISGLASDTEY